MKKQYEEPTVEVLVVRMENVILYGEVKKFNEDDDDIFG